MNRYVENNYNTELQTDLNKSWDRRVKNIKRNSSP